MSLCVDVISEDSFYENLVLGVTKLLDNNPRVSNVIVERKLPVDRVNLSCWEQRHSVTLPEDIRNFYLSTDGFKLKWSFQYSQDDILPVGTININALSDLSYTPGLKELVDHSVSKNSTSSEKIPHIEPKSKIFELDECKVNSKVCLIHSENTWGIWLLDSEGSWTWLANSFTYYFRMALVHQGLPGWQAAFSKAGLVPWAEQLFLLIAPHLLVENGDNNKILMSANDAPLNHIDPSIFKIVTKHTNRTTGVKP